MIKLEVIVIGLIGISLIIGGVIYYNQAIYLTGAIMCLTTRGFGKKKEAENV